ncbi:hypothetical protein [Bradyrhizobium sp. 187]|jgi:hypothetical protein|uniref:hypothetical protein n=1 Tax=Bradyrhizobium sp. 187 TaxID=2782655 RepID=UPI001FFF6420|nr:hypothetical protein [Bradyrhizobium sp. 187]UPJ74534.1 hypothetical protein IVB19_08405 [Bradyrhizobium sp. 187]
MTQPMRDAPRRYIVDGTGQRVLFGLTIAETIEFETLDKPDAPLGPGLRLDQNKPGQRWLELYAKHERAWRNWMADTRAGREVPLVLN